MARELDETDATTVFVAIPLYRAEHRENLQLDEAWAVVADPQTAIERLVTQRGMSVDDATARLTAQMSNDERVALVDRVIWNDGTFDDLYGRLDEVLAESGIA